MAIEVPPNLDLDDFITEAFVDAVRNSIAHLDPDSRAAAAGSLLYVNSGQDGYDILAPAALKFIRFNAAGDEIEAAMPLQGAYARITSDNDFGTNTTFADLTGNGPSSKLAIPIGAGEIWICRAVLDINIAGAGSSGGAKAAFTWPSAPTFASAIGLQVTPALTALPGGTGTSGAAFSTLGSDAQVGRRTIYGDLIIHNGANAGNIVVQGAQDTSDSDLTTFKAGSHLIGWRVG